jgi:hypothetical protein
MKRIEPTDEEKRNGWTADELTAYIEDRERAQAGVVSMDPDYRPVAKPYIANSRYRPNRWRG